MFSLCENIIPVATTESRGESVNKLLSMKQCCEATGMSYETLKFYCNEGLVSNVKRAVNNYRVFDEHNVTGYAR